VSFSGGLRVATAARRNGPTPRSSEVAFLPSTPRSNAARDPWISLTLDSMHLAFDAHQVISLRLMRFALPGWHGEEFSLMVDEKIDASIEAGFAAQQGILNGDSASELANRVTRVFRRRVSANKRRLTR
jgi:hypothetical protein